MPATAVEAWDERWAMPESRADWHVTTPSKSVVCRPFRLELAAGGRWIRTCMGLFSQVVFLVCCRFFVGAGKAVLRPVACDQVRGRAEGVKGPKR